MSDNFIFGISPLSISAIRYKTARRYGVHPYYNYLAKKKHPILSRIPIVMLFFDKSDCLFDGFYKPAVTMYGHDGDCIFCETFPTNDKAKQAHADATVKLNNYLESLKNKEIAIR